jgi:hypothetical protein
MCPVPFISIAPEVLHIPRLLLPQANTSLSQFSYIILSGKIKLTQPTALPEVLLPLQSRHNSVDPFPGSASVVTMEETVVSTPIIASEEHERDQTIISVDNMKSKAKPFTDDNTIGLSTAEHEYPTGVKLALITLALAIAVFIVALGLSTSVFISEH